MKRDPTDGRAEPVEAHPTVVTTLPARGASGHPVKQGMTRPRGAPESPCADELGVIQDAEGRSGSRFSGASGKVGWASSIGHSIGSARPRWR